MLEALVPIFPLESTTIAAAWLVYVRSWPILPITATLAVGYVLVLLLQYQIGVQLGKSRRRAMQRLAVALVDGFGRHPRSYLVLNRLLPGFRVFVALAAGVASRGRRVVFGYSMVGTLLSAPIVGLLLYENRRALPQLGQRFFLLSLAEFAIGTMALLFLLVRNSRRAPANAIKTLPNPQ